MRETAKAEAVGRKLGATAAITGVESAQGAAEHKIEETLRNESIDLNGHTDFLDRLSEREHWLVYRIITGNLGGPRNLRGLIKESAGRAYIRFDEIGNNGEGRTVYLDLENPLLIAVKQ